MSQRRFVTAPTFIEPCLPCVTLRPPSGDRWLHEIKHSGLRLQARRDGDHVRLFAERGEELTPRFPHIVEAVLQLPVKSCIIDGELAGYEEDGRTPFNPLDETLQPGDLSYFAFDLMEVNGFDLRQDAVEDRKGALAPLLRKTPDHMRFNRHFEYEGEEVFRQACRMGFEGVVSKRRGSRYRSGRSTDWLLSKSLDAPLP